MVNQINARNLLSQTKFYESYSRFDPSLGRYETWDEAVDRVMNMHRKKYANKMTDELEAVIQRIASGYKKRLFVGAQRALQFGGDQILKHESRLYNCTSSYADRPEFFGEYLYLLLSGCGVGASVQFHHVNKLPKITARTKQPKTFVVEDSIEGWADAFEVLISSYFTDGGRWPDFASRKVYFDLTKIRPKGSPISGGFLAPGPDPLRRALDRIEHLLTGLVILEKGAISLEPIHVYDICMHGADAVLSGGVRRAATIFLFSPEDTKMMNAKVGDWFTTNPQRARSNNSAVLVRGETTPEIFSSLMKSTREYGEPGFIFTNNKDFTVNPCVSGETILNVKDHDIVDNGVVIAKGSEYTIKMKDYVSLFNEDELNPLVLSYNFETKQNEYMIVTAAALTRKTANVIRIKTEDGNEVTLTPDHKVYTTNRGWVEAESLTVEDNLITIA